MSQLLVNRTVNRQLARHGIDRAVEVSIATGCVTCIAVLDPTTLALRYVCAETNGMGTIGASCALNPCPQGQLCASSSAGPVCTLPCPGGAADCPSGWSCGSIPFNSATLLPPAEAAKVPACVR